MPVHHAVCKEVIMLGATPVAAPGYELDEKTGQAVKVKSNA